MDFTSVNISGTADATTKIPAESASEQGHLLPKEITDLVPALKEAQDANIPSVRALGVTALEAAAGNHAHSGVYDTYGSAAALYGLIKPKMIVTGTLSPDATGTLIYAGVYDGYPSWTSDGLLPTGLVPSQTALFHSGTYWFHVEYDSYPTQIYAAYCVSSAATPEGLTFIVDMGTGVPTVNAVFESSHVYAGMYIHDGAYNHTTVTAYTKVLAFAQAGGANGASSYMTPDKANNRIAAILAGKYLVNYSVSMTCSVNNNQCTAVIYANGSEVPATEATQESPSSAAGKNICVAGTGFVTLAAGQYIELYIKSAASATIRLTQANVTVVRVGA